MKVTNKIVYKQLDQLMSESPTEKLDDESKWVIFSDLHMGDGSSTDDFKRNASLFEQVVDRYYRRKDFSMLLNGDVEELQRFPLKKIIEQWKPIYKLFDDFANDDKLVKTIGNHDLQLSVLDKLPFDYNLTEGQRFDYKGKDIFVFHGHQASKKYQERNQLVGFTLKYFANPLGIKNYSVSHSSKKQYNIEKRVYHYSVYRKVMSIIGHTHRPLFESLHKVERLKFKIEQLCRQYNIAPPEDESDIKSLIKSHKKELLSYHKANVDHNLQNYVYNTLFHIPCLFNSGTVIGKRGITCIEIEDGNISLVHWFDKNISKKYLQQTGYAPEQLDNSDCYRMVINRDTLNYIFTRIHFLS
ncbi:MAG: metallophosphoesterase family protein [Cyclobacteriaceae bacterium]|nr:metallophosphoesterase family protein [Cyclobacteriaceae bacterium HetDA_MAG_MS6]